MNRRNIFRPSWILLNLALLGSVAACGPTGSERPRDSDRPPAHSRDAGVGGGTDAGGADAGASDAGAPVSGDDAGGPAAPAEDAGTPSLDAGVTSDAGAPRPDAGDVASPDAGAGQPDSGVAPPDPVGETPDAGQARPDAGNTQPPPDPVEEPSPADPAPTITLHPQSATVPVGTPHTFTADADEWAEVLWQYRDGNAWVNIPGSSGSATYTTNPVTTSWHDGRAYRARFTNADGTASTSTNAATVTVETTPPAPEPTPDPDPEPTPDPDPTPDPSPPPSTTPNRIHATFESAPLTGFGNASSIRSLLANQLGPRQASYSEGELSVASDGGNTYLRQRYVPSSTGTPVVGYRTTFAGADEMWVSYRLYFEPGFEWVLGGKLPGLFGGSLVSGGSTSTSGFSARMMWRSSGRLAFYAYHYAPDRPSQYGQDIYFRDPSDAQGYYRIPVGRWITVRHHIKLNSGPNTFDGVLEGWVDGVKMVSRHPDQGNGIRWWGPNSSSYDINGFYYSSFYGGADPSWSPSSTKHVRFDDLRVSTTREGVE